MCDTPWPQDALTHKFWHYYFKCYRRYAPPWCEHSYTKDRQCDYYMPSFEGITTIRQCLNSYKFANDVDENQITMSRWHVLPIKCLWSAVLTWGRFTVTKFLTHCHLYANSFHRFAACLLRTIGKLTEKKHLRTSLHYLVPHSLFSGK